MTFLDKTLRAMGAQTARRENARQLAVGGLVGEVGPGPAWVDESRRKSALLHGVLRAALAEVVDVLDDEIPHVVLKGEPLVRTLYGDTSLRSSGDIDLLVLPGDYEEVRRRLMACGYEPRHEEGPRMWAHNQEAMVHAEHGIWVEIHWMLALPAVPHVPLGRVFGSRQAFALSDDLTVDVLAEDWMGIHLALHFHHHTGCVRGLLDMAAWCDRVAPRLEETTFVQKARDCGLGGLVQWPLHTIAILTGDEPPMYVEDVDDPVRAWATVSAWAANDALSRALSGGVRDSLAALMPTVGPMVWVPVEALSMLVVDGDGMVKGEALLRPILHGPHFVGRWWRGLGVRR